MPLVPPGIGVRSPRSRPLRGAGNHARFSHNEFQLCLGVRASARASMRTYEILREDSR